MHGSLHRGLGILAAMSLGAGCGDDAMQPAPPESFVDRGWTAFEAEAFAEAADEFRTAIAENPDDPEAQNGLGWSLLQLGTYLESISSFDEAARLHDQLNTGEIFADPFAGRTIAYHEIDPIMPALVVAYSDTTWQRAGQGYVFEHDPTLNWMDIRFLRIHALFVLGQFERANESLEEIDGNPLDPASDTFVVDLLAEIERLGRDITGR